MIFIFVVFIAWLMYFSGNKVFAYVLFFFFATNGLQVIPEEIMEMGFGFSKGTDYAVVLLMGCVFIDSFLIKGYLRIDGFVKCLLIFFGFLAVCALYSLFVVHCSFSDVTRTTRTYSLLLVYLVFRNMTLVEVKRLLNVMFVLTVCISIVYLLQIVINQRILTNDAVGAVSFLGLSLKRFYNQPLALGFFVFMGIYKNPYKGYLKIFTTAILLLTLMGAFHRSSTGLLFICLILGYVLKLPRVQRIKVGIISLAFLIPTLVVVGNKFVHSRTYLDVKSVIEGNFTDMDLDLNDLANSTFAFRMAHVWERIDYISQGRATQVFGAGLIPEDSKQTDQMFDFTVGLLEELSGRTVQLETSDISYSTLLIRFGYVGTLLFLSIYIYMMVYFNKRRSNSYAFFSFIFIVYSLGISFFSNNLLLPVTYILPILSMSIINKEDA